MKVTITPRYRRRAAVGVLCLVVLVVVALIVAGPIETGPNAQDLILESGAPGTELQWRVSQGGGVRFRIPTLLGDKSLPLDFGDLPRGNR